MLNCTLPSCFFFSYHHVQTQVRQPLVPLGSNDDDTEINQVNGWTSPFDMYIMVLRKKFQEENDGFDPPNSFFAILEEIWDKV